MKAVQVVLDDEVLAALDADDEVRRVGRSAVLRRAAAEYLARKRRERIRSAYQAAYGAAPARELDRWAEEGVWPDE